MEFFKIMNYQYILITSLFFLKIESSDKKVEQIDQDVKNKQQEYIDPMQGCSFQAPKSAIKTRVKSEPIGQKLVKITYSDGSTKIIG